MEREKVIEIFLGLIFIILILIMVFLFTNIASGSKMPGTSTATTATTITNSFNTNTYNNPGIPTITYRNYDGRNYNHISNDYGTKNYNKQYLKYSSAGHYNGGYGILGGKVNDYKVYVRNKEHKGGYFTVKFYITDYYGKKRTESITHYIKPHEERKFMYRNVFHNDREYKYWRYNVNSHTRK